MWRLLYATLPRLYAAYVCRGERGAAVYTRGSLAESQPLYGISDIDLTFVLAGDTGEPGRARERARRRSARLGRLPLAARLFDFPSFFEQSDLEDLVADSVLTHGLDRPAAAAYAGPASDVDKIRVQERPRLYGTAEAWRLIRGPERRPPEPPRDEARRMAAAWLELQYWWRCAVEGALNPEAPWVAPLCSKLVAEPARIWLWLAREIRTGDRADTLALAARELPAEAEAFDWALRLEGRLGRGAEPALAQALPALLRLSGLIADELAARAAPAGTTSVRLVAGELALPHGGWPRELPQPGPALAPLADWRAVVCPAAPDSASVLLEGDPADPAALASLAREFVTSLRPALRAGDLVVRPAAGGRARLRTIQSPLTDPVSFALAAGSGSASFSDAGGWSVQHWARRAVAEHAAWLAAGVEPHGTSLGVLAGAARAALLLESVEAGSPELVLTASAALELLAQRVDAARPVAERAWELYRHFAVHWSPPVPVEAVRELERVVRELPAYAGAGA